MDTKFSVVSKSPVVVHLVKYLLECAEGDQIATYEGMDQATDYDPTRDGRSSLYRALNHIRENYGLVFRNVPAKGYRCVGNAEISGASTELGTYRIGRAIHRWKSELKCVNASRLEQGDFLSYSLAAVKLSIFEQAALDSGSPKTIEKANTYQKTLQELSQQREILKHLSG